MNSGLFPGDPFTDVNNRSRAAAIKQRIGVVEVARRHGAAVRAEAGGYSAPCPCCHYGRLKITAHGETYRCGSCGASGDAITFERAVTGAGFAAACDALEAAFPGASDTADLFEAGS